MHTKILSTATLLLCLCGATWCQAEDVLFEDTFDKELSAKWKAVGLGKDDYRIRDGALEIRVQPGKPKGGTPMLKVDLPFTTSDTVIASVEVTVVGEPLRCGAQAGLMLTDQDGSMFTVRKTNIDGYFLLRRVKLASSASRAKRGTPASTRSSTGPPTRQPGRCESSSAATTPSFKSGHRKRANTRRCFTRRSQRPTRAWALA